MDGFECGAIMHIAASDTACGSEVLICPRVAVHVRNSYFLQWETLSAQNRISVGNSCTCEFAAGYPPQQVRLKAKDVWQLAGCPGASVEIADVLDRNREKMSVQKDSLNGRAGLLIGTGPSLNTVDLREWEHVPSIGCNKLFLLDKKYRFRPTHYVIEDRLLLEDCAKPIADYSGPIRWAPLDHLCLNNMECYFPLWRSYDGFPRFSTDALSGLFSGWTVSFCMLQLAAYLGLKRIGLIGLDGTYNIPDADYDGPVGTSRADDLNHFDSDYYGPGTRFHAPEAARVEAAYASAAVALTSEGIEVINCSPTSAISCFTKGTIMDALG